MLRVLCCLIRCAYTILFLFFFVWSYLFYAFCVVALGVHTHLCHIIIHICHISIHTYVTSSYTHMSHHHTHICHIIIRALWCCIRCAYTLFFLFFFFSPLSLPLRMVFALGLREKERGREREREVWILIVLVLCCCSYRSLPTVLGISNVFFRFFLEF